MVIRIINMIYFEIGRKTTVYLARYLDYIFHEGVS